MNPTKDDVQSSSELCDVSPKIKKKLSQNYMPLLNSSSSGMSASAKTIYGIVLRRTEGGIYD